MKKTAQLNNITASNTSEEATISGVVGNLKVTRSDGTSADTSSGYVPENGDTVKTDAKGAVINNFWGGEITIGPNSEFKLEINRTAIPIPIFYVRVD